jgi:hypothetical protein
MHDDQHIARLFLLDQGLKQGYLYPRWVDFLGFGFGYPLFNFYPPLVYYVSEIFHLLELSLTWSIKLTFILGFILAAWGIFLLIKRLLGRSFGFIASVFYTYFFYHAVLIYVRGALAEFFSLTILPFVFLTFENLKRDVNFKNSVFFGFTITLLILTHPLIAFPSTIYIFLFLAFYLLFQSLERLKFFAHSLFAGLIGLTLSSFYWIPSMFERNLTLVDKILVKELANYKIHFICFKQFLYSNWGYGGSIPGCNDGMTFQLGRAHIVILFFSLISFVIYLFYKKLSKEKIYYFIFFMLLFVFSVFMTTSYSSFIWNNFKYLWYLQFPWRFLTFAGFFISVVGAYGAFLFWSVLKNSLFKKFFILAISIFSIFTIWNYGKYFSPQYYIKYEDYELTGFREISWRVSRTSFEFLPKSVKTVKSQLKTTIPKIKPKDISYDVFKIVNGNAVVKKVQNKFQNKSFLINAENNIVFRLNTFNFPGWKAYLNKNEININDDNDFKLITVSVPKGRHTLDFIFEETLIRKIADCISIISLIVLIPGFYFTSSKR